MVSKIDSKLADKAQIPQIGNALDAIPDAVVTGTYATDDDGLKATIDAILAALRYHGLIKT